MANEIDLPTQIEQLKREQRSLIKAVRLLLAFFVLVLAVVCVRNALSIPGMSAIFRDMLPGQALPTSTRIVATHPIALLTSAITLGLLGLGLLLIGKTPEKRFVAAAIVAVLLLIQWQLVSAAMQEPFFKLFSAIGEPEKENSPGVKQPKN
jgi:hypothetical protein